MKTFLTVLCISAAMFLNAGNKYFSTTTVLFGNDPQAYYGVVSTSDTNQLDASGQKTGFWNERIGGYEWHGYYVN
jgi:hypothetical protein